MSGIYKTNHFRIEELVSPEFYEANKSRGELMWLAFDARVLITLDLLRKVYGPLTVNDWLWGGPFKYSGLRSMDCEEGAALSQHKFGRAADAKFKNVTADEVRNDMRKKGLLAPENKWSGSRCFDSITCIEETPNMSWFHFDVRNWDAVQYGVRVVKG
ncbi:peptidase M15 [Maridesulfovibrio ferrireducens]|uniref:peptidase M15 n=1 Tax=Maridesulfovibrio ferrireducens TaxID=246191 RepID=UPI001A344B2B|nr:peptidase M15 [Maridesulfovibrio ferrireducens]MBI9113281.1 peptidase M15 [Maridesulfovibrio ferrireducens]